MRARVTLQQSYIEQLEDLQNGWQGAMLFAISFVDSQDSPSAARPDRCMCLPAAACCVTMT